MIVSKSELFMTIVVKLNDFKIVKVITVSIYIIQSTGWSKTAV